MVEGKFSTPRKIVAGVTQGFILALILYSLYINVTPVAHRTHLALFADDTHIYTAHKHECRVLCKLQCDLTAVYSWCEHWNIKINDRKFRQSVFPEVPDDIQLNR
jgi:hypothetical protein